MLYKIFEFLILKTFFNNFWEYNKKEEKTGLVESGITLKCGLLGFCKQIYTVFFKYQIDIKVD